VQAGLRAGNVAYEERFGHVFLICATGMSAASVLAALQARLGHDPAAERAVVRDELMKIVRLRLAKAFE
jgi:2-oxo-4-hydroxy-4-carboxy-5-ureidoimidazoline decarboxylase